MSRKRSCLVLHQIFSITQELRFDQTLCQAHIVMNEPKQSKRVVEDDEKLFINLFMVIDSVLIWPEVCWSCWLGLPDRVCLWPLPSPGEIAA